MGTSIMLQWTESASAVRMSESVKYLGTIVPAGKASQREVVAGQCVSRRRPARTT